MASSRIKLLLLITKTTNSQHSVSSQFHHAAHGYTLSNSAASSGWGGLSVLVRGGTLVLPIEVETGWDDMPVFNYAPDMAYGEDGQRLPNAFSAAELGLHAELFLNLFQSYEVFNTLSAQGKECSAIEAHYKGLKTIVLAAAVRVIRARQEDFVVEQWAAACRFLEQAKEAAEAQKAEEVREVEAQEAYWAAQAVAWETNAEGDWANKAQEAVWAAEFEREEAQRAAEAAKAEEAEDKCVWDYWEGEAAAYKAEVDKGVWDDETQEALWDAQYAREEAREARIAAQMAELAMDYWEHSRTWYD